MLINQITAFSSLQSPNLFARFSIVLTWMATGQRHLPKSMCSVKHRGKNTDRINEVTFTAIAERVPSTLPCLISSGIHTGFTRIRTWNLLIEFTLQSPHQCWDWNSLIMQANFVRERCGGKEEKKKRKDLPGAEIGTFCVAALISLLWNIAV